MPERIDKSLARVASALNLDKHRLRTWVSFLALCGVLERAIEEGVIHDYYIEGGVALDKQNNKSYLLVFEFPLSTLQAKYGFVASLLKIYDFGIVFNKRKESEVIKEAENPALYLTLLDLCPAPVTPPKGQHRHWSLSSQNS